MLLCCFHHHHCYFLESKWFFHPPLPTSQFLSVLVHFMLVIINSTHFHSQKYVSFDNSYMIPLILGYRDLWDPRQELDLLHEP